MSVTLEPAQTVDIGVGFFDQLNQHDIDGALQQFSGDATVTLEAVGVEAGGVADLRRYLEALFGGFPDAQFRLVRTARFDHSILVEVLLQGNQQRDFLGAGNQGGHLRSAGAWRFTTCGERITGVTGYWCQNLVHRRLGVAAAGGAR